MTAIFDGLPREMTLRERGISQLRQQFTPAQFRKIGNIERLRSVGPYPPNPTTNLIAIGMRAWNLVVRDDLVVPIDDVKAAVRAHSDGDRTKPLITRDSEIRELLEPPPRPISMHL